MFLKMSTACYERQMQFHQPWQEAVPLALNAAGHVIYTVVMLSGARSLTVDCISPHKHVPLQACCLLVGQLSLLQLISPFAACHSEAARHEGA